MWPCTCILNGVTRSIPRLTIHMAVIIRIRSPVWAGSKIMSPTAMLPPHVADNNSVWIVCFHSLYVTDMHPISYNRCESCVADEHSPTPQPLPLESISYGIEHGENGNWFQRLILSRIEWLTVYDCHLCRSNIGQGDTSHQLNKCVRTVPAT